ncbi:serine hydrolase domain-containing protein [Aureispira anguillae]|uniref:serine hydrolase domain-containing protein n=1 Tax=Aureispira anguillae TaxID=2864201 RepID=UPI002232A111|nr:serine hydrolase domain-containing protein [Aureispira anguillae]
MVLILMAIVSCQQPSVTIVDTVAIKIDSLLSSNPKQAFNGIVLVTQEGEEPYVHIQGFSNVENKKELNLDDQFVIGSISKQITAVLILQAYERGDIALDQPIGKYLLNSKQTWKDSVTIHHLLTHTHGIVALDEPLAFMPSTQFQYSQLGYELLANILEAVTHQSFADLSTELFQKQGLKHTVHPKARAAAKLVKGYTEMPNKTIVYEANSLQNYVPAGSFISTANDLAAWNRCLHSGQLLKDSSFDLMVSDYETRKHPIFGEIEYGYGLTFKKGEAPIQIGALGFAPGFVSSNFYFPSSKTTVVILENVARNLEDFKKTFYYHIKILTAIREQH